MGCGSQLSAPLFPSPGDRGSDFEGSKPACGTGNTGASSGPASDQGHTRTPARDTGIASGHLLSLGPAGDTGNARELLSLDLAHGDQPSQCRHTTPGEANRKKRKRSKADSSGTMEDAYHCPPSCTTFAECTEMNRTVNLIALVIQGLISKRYYVCEGLTKVLLYS